MEKTVGTGDALFRAIVGVVLLVAGVVADVHPIAKIIVFLASAAMFVTASSALCPLYSAIGVSTHGGKEQEKQEGPAAL
jgi:hypothetical protein